MGGILDAVPINSNSGSPNFHCEYYKFALADLSFHFPQDSQVYREENFKRVDFCISSSLQYSLLVSVH